jgi:hypothetical protein
LNFPIGSPLSRDRHLPSDSDLVRGCRGAVPPESKAARRRTDSADHGATN